MELRLYCNSKYILLLQLFSIFLDFSFWYAVDKKCKKNVLFRRYLRVSVTYTSDFSCNLRQKNVLYDFVCVYSQKYSTIIKETKLIQLVKIIPCTLYSEIYIYRIFSAVLMRVKGSE